MTRFVVEDDAIVLRGLIGALEEIGGSTVVGTTASARSAVVWLQGHPRDWNLVIGDLCLAEGAGLDVLRGCRQRSSRQRAAMPTNDATEIRERSLALGAGEVVDKWTEIEQLMAYCADLSAK